MTVRLAQRSHILNEGTAGGLPVLLVLLALATAPLAEATPANRSALRNHFGPTLPETVESCATCHVRAHADGAESLEDFPHNAFGEHLHAMRRTLRDAGEASTLVDRFVAIADEDSDGDGVANLAELLLGHPPGRAESRPSSSVLETDLATAEQRYRERLEAYPWRPFEPVERPKVPTAASLASLPTTHPIDTFIAAERHRHGLEARPPADRATWLRRVTIDLTGLTPSADEVRTFVDSPAPDETAFAAVVDRLLASPHHGERWGRHWMDVWRYSDWAGYRAQLRESQKHIWRWRDWIIDSLNADKGYDQMLREMLAADELYPEDADRLPATGYLARSYHSSNRNQWLDDVVSHSAQAFLGITMGCVKCHDHMYDDIPQQDYYRMRAVFEPYWVRTDRVPGQLDREVDGLPRVYDRNLTARTLLFERGDERHPVDDSVIEPGLPAILGGERFSFEPVTLPLLAHRPQRREFVVSEMMAAEADALQAAREKRDRIRAESGTQPAVLEAAELGLAAAELKREALVALLEAEGLEDRGMTDTDQWRKKALETQRLQRESALAEARAQFADGEAKKAAAQAKRDQAKADSDAAAETAAGKSLAAADKAIAAARKAVTAAEKALQADATTEYQPRQTEAYPETSSGRRSGFATWLTDRRNPLAARVAMNHIWLRHFGSAIVPTVNEFGGNGQPPSHPALLDWLAAEFMEQGWSMKAMHRMIVLSDTYRMASTPDDASAAIDPDNRYYWRMNSRRMEGEIVRDNLLWIGDKLDTALGGPDIPNTEALTSKRRSIYLRHAHEKLVEFVQIFDGPKTTECYRREESVQPHQALALSNSPLTLAAATGLDSRLPEAPEAFVEAAWLEIIGRFPNSDERDECLSFLAGADGKDRRDRQRLITVLLNHHEFVTVR